MAVVTAAREAHSGDSRQHGVNLIADISVQDTQCVWRNIAVRSCDGCSCGKPVILNIILALVTRHANRIFSVPYCVATWPVGLSSCFSALSHKQYDWGVGGVTEHKNVLISYTTCVQHLSLQNNSATLLHVSSVNRSHLTETTSFANTLNTTLIHSRIALHLFQCGISNVLNSEQKSCYQMFGYCIVRSFVVSCVLQILKSFLTLCIYRR